MCINTEIFGPEINRWGFPRDHYTMLEVASICTIYLTLQSRAAGGFPPTNEAVANWHLHGHCVACCTPSIDPEIPTADQHGHFLFSEEIWVGIRSYSPFALGEGGGGYDVSCNLNIWLVEMFT